MNLGIHASFILAAYGAAAMVLGLLVLWVLLDHRAQKRALAALEEEGIRPLSQRGTKKGHSA